ncbi:MAG: alpha/beta hydrolase [Caulobacteraceae bacterium]|nr:alpha/beta hydrolase [Caulobacteraceae bacterium]
MARPTTIMVHGAFCGGWAFDAFRAPFEAAGHAVLAPSLKGHAPGQPVAGLSMADYAEDVARLIRAQEAPPVLIGHSLGGLVAQMAAARAPVRALVLLAPSAPWGVAGGSLEEAISAVSLYALGPFWMQAIDPDYASARHYSLDRMDKAARKAVFDRMTPESGRALWETLNWWLDPFLTTQVAPGRVRAPVLALVGDRDLIHPPATVRQTADRLGGETRVLPGMSHWLLSEPGWETVARGCLDWLAGAERVSAA